MPLSGTWRCYSFVLEATRFPGCNQVQHGSSGVIPDSRIFTISSLGTLCCCWCCLNVFLFFFSIIFLLARFHLRWCLKCSVVLSTSCSKILLCDRVGQCVNCGVRRVCIGLAMLSIKVQAKTTTTIITTKQTNNNNNQQQLNK